MTLALVIAAFALIAAGTYRQSSVIFGRLPPARRRRALVGAGYAVLTLSLIVNATGPDAARRVIEWFGLMSLAALIVIIACWVRAQRATASRKRGR